MSRRTKDCPCTEAEVRCLSNLADLRDDERRAKMWSSGGARNVTTLDNLRDRGLVETRERPTCTVARITDAGYALIRSTGD